jgi:hypothetical protein
LGVAGCGLWVGELRVGVDWDVLPCLLKIRHI